MIIREFPVSLNIDYPLVNEYKTEKIVFFDIETTGLSAETSYLYLIGCIYMKDSYLHFIQWFSENVNEEALLVRNFFEFIKDYDLLISYNGSGFDIPYLIKKCNMLKLDYSFSNIRILDLYKKISPVKRIIKLDNYKQKTVETFLNVKREDILSGEELIEVYARYLGKRQIERLKKSRKSSDIDDVSSEADQLLYLLLLHNEDDIKGLVRICPILYYSDLFGKTFHIIKASVSNGELSVDLEYNFNIPYPVDFGNGDIRLSAVNNNVTVTIKTYEGELKYFYENYRDYFYLPEEDRAIHKSVAIFVDKKYRKKASPSNCYTKKQGTFVPQYGQILTPCFKRDYKDKISFVEVHTDALLQEDNLIRYIKHILNYLTSIK